MEFKNKGPLCLHVIPANSSPPSRQMALCLRSFSCSSRVDTLSVPHDPSSCVTSPHPPVLTPDFHTCRHASHTCLLEDQNGKIPYDITLGFIGLTLSALCTHSGIKGTNIYIYNINFFLTMCVTHKQTWFAEKTVLTLPRFRDAFYIQS